MYYSMMIQVIQIVLCEKYLRFKDKQQKHQTQLIQGISDSKENAPQKDGTNCCYLGGRYSHYFSYIFTFFSHPSVFATMLQLEFFNLESSYFFIFLSLL